jgi:hypothetical protein
VRTGAAVGTGLSVLGEDDLDANKRAHIVGLTYARGAAGEAFNVFAISPDFPAPLTPIQS